MTNVFSKDPNATLDFGFDWSQWLATGESISSYTITVSGSTTLTKISDTNTSGSVIVWLSGGTSGSRYEVACLITTSANRTDERTIKLDIRNR